MKGIDPALRADFLTGLRIMEREGLTEAFGHLSARLDEDRILFTPAMGPGMAGAEDLVVLDNEGSQIGGASAALPLERFLHLAIYRARGDVGAICRTHSPACVIHGATRGHSLPMLHGFGLMLGREVPLYPGMDLITTMEAGERVADTLDSATAVLLRGNGALATGPTLRHAIVHAVYLEDAARIAIHAGTSDLPVVHEEVYHARRKWSGNERARAWTYYASRAS